MSLVRKPREQTITVYCTSLDNFAGVNPGLDLIKIDVEGAVSEPLKGAEALFNRCRPSVICEVHDASNDLLVSDWLEDKGYSKEHIRNRSEYPTHLVATPL